MSLVPRLRAAVAFLCFLLSWPAFGATPSADPRQAGREPVCLVVMDPLCKQLACACVPGFAQREYKLLEKFLSSKLGRPVEVLISESLKETEAATGGKVDLVIGKSSLVEFHAKQLGLSVKPLLRLTDKEGKTTLTGLFVVSTDSPLKTLADLKDRKILFGTPDNDELHAAALAILKSAGLPVSETPATKVTCNQLALAVAEKEADAAVISGYSIPLLEGCGTIDKGSLRVIAQTAPVPFITVFATGHLPTAEVQSVVDALLAVRENAALKESIESRDGFVPLPASIVESGWTDWRGGPHRDGISPAVPARLPSTPNFLWRRKMAGAAMAGVAVQGPYLIVADKTNDEREDCWRCLDAESGRELWSLIYSAPGELDYTNTPRATPVIRDDKVYLLGAFGLLHCLELKTGKVLWKRDLLKEFPGKEPQWGFCPAPLIDGDRLITGTASTESALIALNRHTGELFWKTAGNPLAHAAMLLDNFGGRRQIVGYDNASLGGWDPESGKRLWSLQLKGQQDFNVPTPLKLGDQLLVATENHGTRLYKFSPDGTICPEPVASSGVFKPNTCTPVAINGLLFGVSDGALHCLDLAKPLAARWSNENEMFADYASLIAGNGRVLVCTTGGQLLLIAADGASCQVISKLALFESGPNKIDVWSHPALVGDRLYVRSQSELVCLLLGP